MVNICVTNFEFTSRVSSLTHLNTYKLSDEKWALSQAVVSDEFLDQCRDISRISSKLLGAFLKEILCICRCLYVYLSKKWHVYVSQLFHSLMWGSNENDVRKGSGYQIGRFFGKIPNRLYPPPLIFGESCCNFFPRKTHFRALCKGPKSAI